MKTFIWYLTGAYISILKVYEFVVFQPTKAISFQLLDQFLALAVLLVQLVRAVQPLAEDDSH